MTLQELRDKVIEKGLVSIQQETNLNNIAAGIAGLEACRNLLSLVDYEIELNKRYKESFALMGHENIEAYWRHRWETIQIEYVYEIIKVAYRSNDLSCRAIMAYDEILSGK